MRYSSQFGFAALLGASLSFMLPATAAVWTELDAGDTLAAAEKVSGSPAPLTDIVGSLTSTVFVDANPFYQVDLYQIYVADFASFSAATASPTANSADDTSLFLFDALGHGIYSNDDNGFDLLSTLPTGGPTSNGYYYLGVSLGGFLALDASGANLFTAGSIADVLAGNPAAGSLDHWEAGFPSVSEAAFLYDVQLTGVSLTGGVPTAVPEPTSVLLLALGLAGVAARTSTRRRSAPR